MEWPKNYVEELARRMELEHRIANDPVMLAGAKALYKESLPTFVSDCVWLAEPRNANRGEPVRIPSVLFPRQRDYLEWLVERFQSRTSAPVEKSRDSGATWMACAFAVWLWLFQEGATIGFGSRKEIYVDQRGVMDSIFEKARTIISYLPHYLKPPGLDPRAHFNHMRIANPDNGAAIIGEAGDNIGRGGRTSVYIIDEAAYLERPHLVEAALTATTDCRIDISTPCVGTVFNAAIATNPNKFIFDINDAPWHTEAWKAQKKKELEDKGLGHIYRQEYLRDSTAGIAGQLIKSDWIEAAVGAAERLGITLSGKKRAALDVADGGLDKNAVTLMYGIEVKRCTSRRDLFADAAGLWAYDEATRFEAEVLKYDSIGVGAGAAASLRNKTGIKNIEGWAASGEVHEPNRKYEGNRTNADMFANAKAQGWWRLRDKFFATYRAITGQSHNFDPDALISLDPAIPELRQLKSELAQIVYKHNAAGKVIIDKTPDGLPSPNLADSVMICNAPSQIKTVVLGGWV